MKHVPTAGFWRSLWCPVIPDAAKRSVIGAALIRASVLWGGEVAVALLPLLAKVMIALYSIPGDKALHGPYEELNVATIVLSGLALLVVFKVGIDGPTTNVTPITYVAAMISIVLLVAASLLYAVTSVQMQHNNEVVTEVCLGLALLMSLLVSLEQAWLGILYSPTTEGGNGDTDTMDS